MKKYWWVIVVISVLGMLYYVLPRYVWVNHGYIGFRELQQQYKNHSGKPVFSVILPTYNRAAYLPRAITSVQGQTFTDFELIIVNDGSTDNTKEIVRKFQENDPRIIYIESDRNYGVSHARNLAIQAAKGKYISILDSDDMFFPALFATQYNYLRDHPNADVVVVKPYQLSDDGSVKGGNYPSMNSVMFLFKNYMINIGTAIRRSFLQETGVIFEEGWHTAEDYKFYADLMIRGARFHMLDQYLVGIRFHDTNTRQYYKEMDKHANAVKILMKEHFSASSRGVCNYIKDVEKKQYDQFSNIDIMRAKILFCSEEYEGNYYILRDENEDDIILIREHGNLFCEVSSKQCGFVKEFERGNQRCLSIVWNDSQYEDYFCQFVLEEYWRYSK